MMLPKRKLLRMPDYNYNSPGYYFITICSENKKQSFWNSDGNFKEQPENDSAPWLFQADYTPIGMIIEEAIQKVSQIYKNISVEKYCIMPNHIHLLVMFEETQENNGNLAVLAKAISQMKSFVSKQTGYSVWQRGYYDHVIRNEEDYLAIWKYIDENPMKWQQDQYYD